MSYTCKQMLQYLPLDQGVQEVLFPPAETQSGDVNTLYQVLGKMSG